MPRGLRPSASHHHLTELWPAAELRLGVSLGNPWRQIPNLLGHISEQAHEDHGLLLSALVVEEGLAPQPGEGFFRLAAALGLLAERDSPAPSVPWQGMTHAQRAFWEEQVSAIFAHFAT